MQRLKGWVVVAVCVGLLTAVGCQSHQTAEANYKKFRAQDAALESRLQTLEEQQAEMAVLRPAGGDNTDTAGGPAPAPVQPVTVARLSGSQVGSGRARAGVSPSGKATLDQVAMQLNTELTSGTIVIEGHTDSDPIRRLKNYYSDNYALGRARAQNVADYLATKGVDRNRMRVETFGPDKPISKSKSQNRRVEIVVMAAQ